MDSEIRKEKIIYNLDDLEMHGHLVYDVSGTGRRPGVLVVHEFIGINDYSRRRALMLANSGYTALAVDMFGNGKNAADINEARELSKSVMTDPVIAYKRFEKAYEFLKTHETVDPSKIGAIGYCFGGGVVLHMARFGMDLKAVVSFHGRLTTGMPAEKGKVKATILVCDGEADKMTTPEVVENFKKEMESAGVNYKFISYKSAKHAFTNPDADGRAKKFNSDNIGYNKQADIQSWDDMIECFKKHLN